MLLPNVTHKNFLYDILLFYPLLYWTYVNIQDELGTYVPKMTLLVLDD